MAAKPLLRLGFALVIALLGLTCLGPAFGQAAFGARRIEAALPPDLPAEPSAAATQLAALPLVEEMLSQVSAATLAGHVARLSGEAPLWIAATPYTLTTRYTWVAEPISMATAYAARHLEALGLATAFHSYSFYGSERRNVVAEQAGIIAPERIYLITAHIDSISGSPYTVAPGADDNASGAAAVLSIAEILSRYRLPYTIRYVLFSGEEQGMVGSKAYAAEVHSAGDEIAGVLNLDMIGYNSDGLPEPVIELHTRSGDAGLPDRAIAELMVECIASYDLDLTAEIVASGITASDHSSFWAEGYPAILAIEDFQDFTPYYHTVKDRLSTLDMGYFTGFAQAALAAVAHMAGAIDFVYSPSEITVTYPVTFALASPWEGPPVSTTWTIANGPPLLGETAVVSFPFTN